MNLGMHRGEKAGSKLGLHRGNATDVGTATDKPSTAKPASKTKRKKFRLFKKNKKKTNKTPPATPDTINEADAEILSLSSDHVVSVFAVGDASSPPRRMPVDTGVEQTEEELNNNLSWARSLLAELDLANADAGSDEEAEGMELILPSPKYEVVDEKVEVEKDDIGDEKNEVEVEPAIEKHIEDENEEADKSPIQSDEKPAEEINEENNDESNTEEKEAAVVEENKDEKEAAVVEEKQDEVVDPRNSSIIVEEKVGEEDLQPPESRTTVAAKILTAAFGCMGEDDEPCGEGISESMYKTIGRRSSIDLEGMFDERTGSDFLHNITNVGYTLVYHIAVDEDSWVGRTVNLNFRPGLCNSETIVQPVIEWKTMVGGKSNSVETKQIRLLNIDTIAPSNAREEDGVPSPIEPSHLPIPAKPPTNQKNDVGTSMCNLSFIPGGVEDEFDCFFTVTSQDGEIHLFEALDSEDCRRIVGGIRYSAQRLSQLLIEGDTTVLLSDFYDTPRDSEESNMTKSEIINKLSNAYLDGQ